LHGNDFIQDIELLVRDHHIRRVITCGHSLGGALSQIFHIQLHDKLRVPGQELELINVTFATPMVGNHFLRENLGDIAGRMYHFVEAEDIVPALLFTRHLYQNLALSDWQLQTILWVAGCKSDLQERANTLKEDLSLLKTDEPSAENAFAPIGNYLLLDDNKLYELPCDDPTYIAQALIPALNVLRQITVTNQAWRYIQKVATLGWYDETAATKILGHHELKNYHEKLTALGFANPPN